MSNIHTLDWHYGVDIPEVSSVATDRAALMLAAIAKLREEHPLSEAINQSWERFVEAEPDTDLRQLSEVILDARRQNMIQQQLNDDRDQLHQGKLSHEEDVSVGLHYTMLRREACTYNHVLKAVISHWGPQMSREQLTAWLTTVSQGRREWAEGEITGAVSELVLREALSGIFELEDVRFTTVDEDLHGADIVATFKGHTVTFDAKTGHYPELTELKHGSLHIEVSVPRESVDDFSATKSGLSVLRRHVRVALHYPAPKRPIPAR